MLQYGSFGYEDKSHSLDLLEDGRVLHDTHAEQLIRPPVLVKDGVGVLAELLHVRPHEHLAELDEVAVVLVVDLDDTPGVRAATDLATIRRVDKLVRADDRERNLARDLLSLGNSLLILVLVGRRLKDMNVMVRNVGQHLVMIVVRKGTGAKTQKRTYPSLELGNFLIREGIRLRDDRNQVHLGVQLAHELNVDGLQPVGHGNISVARRSLLSQTTHE